MNTNELAQPKNNVKEELPEDMISSLVLNGDLRGLKPQQKVEYYRALCARLGLDPATQPLKLLKLQGREILYCDRSGAQQLNRKHGIGHQIMAREVVNDCYVVTARATAVGGRYEESIGAVPILGLKGEALCNAMMKAETKAKRRSTLDLSGLGMLDESELGEWSAAGQTTSIEDESKPVRAMARREMKDEPEPKSKVLEEVRREMAAAQANVAPKRFGNWRDCIMHFSKNAGKALGELSNKQLSWYYEEWMPKRKADKKWPIKEKETMLFDALEAWHKEVSDKPREDEEPTMSAEEWAAMQKQKEVEASWDVGQDEVPMS